MSAKSVATKPDAMAKLMANNQGDPDKLVHDFCRVLEVLNQTVGEVKELLDMANDPKFKEALASCKSIAAHAAMHIDVRNLAETVGELSSTITRIFDHNRIAILPGLMEAQGVETVKVAGVGRVSVRDDMYVSMLKDGTIVVPEVDDQGSPTGDSTTMDPVTWLCCNDLGDLVQETVNASSLKAAIKRKIAAGVPVPPELFKVTPHTFATVTKA